MGMAGSLFPYFFVGTFIEGARPVDHPSRPAGISLLFRRDFH